MKKNFQAFATFAVAQFVVLQQKYEKEGFTNFDGDLRKLYDFFKETTTKNAKLPVPSDAVDNIWHNMILDTKVYPEMCNLFFGRFIHHLPNKVMAGCSSCDGKAEQAVKELMFQVDNGCGSGSCDSRASCGSTSEETGEEECKTVKMVAPCGSCDSE
jgi:hypothetical protein